MEHISLERMNYSSFIKKNTTWRASQFNRFIPLNADIQLPTGAVLHLMDNIVNGANIRDIPSMSNVLILNETSKRYLYHNTKLIDKDDPLYVKQPHRFPSAGLNKSIMEFNKTHRSALRPITDYTKVVDDNTLTVINHNPLWRTKVVGKLSAYKRFDLIMRSILSVVKSIPSTKNQFIYIPLTERAYERQQILRPIKDKITPSTLAFDDQDYMFILELMTFLYEGKKIKSLFDEIPNTYRSVIHIVFVVGSTAIFFSLEDMKNVVKNQSLWMNFLIYINKLKLSADGYTIDELKNVAPKEIDEAINRQQAKYVDLSPLLGDVTEVGIGKEPEPINIAPVPDSPVLSIDEEAQAYIDQLEDITPSQKSRLEVLSKKYKTVKIGNRTIEEILNEPVDLTIDKKELSFLKDEIPDDSMLTSSVINLDEQYMTKLFQRDMSQVITSFSKNGLYLTDFEVTPQIDELNRVAHYRLTYENAQGKRSTVKYKFPIIDKDGTFTINGITNRMKKQQVNTPICKISPTRVSLAASYKTLVERNTTKAHSFKDFITKYIDKVNKDKQVIETKLGGRVYTDRLPYEYTTLGSRYKSLRIGNNLISFDYKNRETLSKDPKAIKLESQYGVLVGKVVGKPNEMLYIGMDNNVRKVNIVSNDELEITSITDIIADNTDVLVPMVSEWTELKILDQKIPIIFILSYRYGLMEALKRLKIDYRLYDKGVKVENLPTDIVIKFNNKTLVVNRYPIQHSQILAGMLTYKTNKIDIEEFESANVYYDLLLSKRISTNYIKGIDRFFELFLDPITKDVLQQMGEPTNITDLLIRASGLLATEDYIEPASMRNHMIRTYSRMNSVLYDEMARKLAEHRSQNRSDKFSINPEAVFQRIAQDQAVGIVEDINPVHNIKDKTGYTHTGVGGRTATSFVDRDRKYPKDGVGIISEATPDSGKVALTAYTSMDPRIANLRGLYDIVDDEPEPTEMLSITGILMPKVTGDDKHINLN